MFQFWGTHESHDWTYVHVGDGFSGLVFRVVLSGDTMTGRAWDFTDFERLPIHIGHKVRAVRRPCAPAA
jgi:hypothetical protein